jgi:aconitate hydratase
VQVERADGSRFSFKVIARVDSQVDIEYLRNGGILHTVLRAMLAGRAGATPAPAS